MSHLLEFFGMTETGDQSQHSQHCVCRGTGEISTVTHGTTGLNGSTPIQGNKKVPCPYGDLRVNKPTPSVDNDPEDWDL